MRCGRSPEIDVVWANGHGRAWFCLEHFQEWTREDQRGVIRAHVPQNGKVPQKLSDYKVKGLRSAGEKISTRTLIQRARKRLNSG